MDHLMEYDVARLLECAAKDTDLKDERKQAVARLKEKAGLFAGAAHLSGARR
jgi:hypothetical protein